MGLERSVVLLYPKRDRSNGREISATAERWQLRREMVATEERWQLRLRDGSYDGETAGTVERWQLWWRDRSSGGEMAATAGLR